MRRERLERLLEAFRRGEAELEDVLSALEAAPVEAMGFATLDHHRSLRLGHPEAVYCPGKSVEQLVAICSRLAEAGDGFLATRATEAQLDSLAAAFDGLEVSRSGRIAHLPPEESPSPRTRGEVLVVTAGTADLPVAEEARMTALSHGNPVTLRADVGVAGLHRILSVRDELAGAAVVIVVAGLDGALPSVVGGLVGVPVVAVPTSAGYGAALGGIAALLTMLNSCAPGVVVTNIDNGYGAACAATRINQSSPAGPFDGAEGRG